MPSRMTMTSLLLRAWYWSISNSICSPSLLASFGFLASNLSVKALAASALEGVLVGKLYLPHPGWKRPADPGRQAKPPRSLQAHQKHSFWRSDKGSELEQKLGEGRQKHFCCRAPSSPRPPPARPPVSPTNRSLPTTIMMAKFSSDAFNISCAAETRENVNIS